MRSQQQAEKAEQQRIKQLVLDYDLRDDEAETGIYGLSSPLSENPNHCHGRSPPWSQPGHGLSRPKQSNTTEQPEGIEKHHNPYAQVRVDKASSARAAQRGRKLQLSDVDWYGYPGNVSPSTTSSASSRRPRSQPAAANRRCRKPGYPKGSGGG
jgi:regulator of nonsense transcripts 2